MLKGKNVVIRPMEKKDIELFYGWMSNQENVGDFMYADLMYKEPFVESMENKLKDNSRMFTIIEDNSGNPIGVMNYREIMGISSTLEIGIMLSQATLRGKGIGSECINLFVNHLFNSKQIARIQFITRADNMSMRTIGKKAGFELEGILRNYLFEHGSYRDFCIMAITRGDWNLRQSE